MKKGFTLLELLLVMVILGILATLITGNFINSLKKGRDAKRKSDLDQIQKALEMYYEDKKIYPPTLSFGGQLCYDTCLSGDKIYMQRVPNDPILNKTYYYVTDANNTYFKLYACLENDQQTLPYTSTPPPGFSCSTQCRAPNGANVECVWGISSPNTTP